jgi:phosphatidylglycerol---prolipoprotein diacylglyceryl transferase
MHPILLEIPSLGITILSYRVCLLLAVLLCWLIGPRWVAALEGLDPWRVFRAMVLLGLAAFAGARLHFVLTHWGDFADRPLAALQFWSGGLHAGGGIVLLTVAAPFVLGWLRLPLGRFADGFVPTVGVGIAIARLGCFLHGCCFGTLCSWPWCVTFPRNTYIYQYHIDLGVLPFGAERTLPIHPLQLYFAASGLMITAAALWLHPRKRYDGEVALVGLVLFSTSTAILEFLRADAQPRVYWGALPQLTWIALAMSAASLVALAAVELVHRGNRIRSVRSRRPVAQAPLSPRPAPVDTA